MWILLMVPFIAYIAMPMISFAQEPNCSLRKCPGKAANDHNDGDYHFKTTSRVYEDGIDQVYETCVENVGDKDLEVNWVIPGPETVVLKGCAVSAYRPQSTRDTIDNYKGCIRYGATWSWGRSPFFPHSSESGDVEAEKEEQCRDHYVAGALGDVKSQPRNIEIRSERFGSSVYEDFLNTLSKIEFFLNIKLSSEDGTYTTDIDMMFSPAYKDNAKYYIKGYIIRPVGQVVDSGYLSKASGNPMGGFFAGGKSINYTLRIPENPIQKFVRYRVFSIDERSIASIDVPIWIERN